VPAGDVERNHHAVARSDVRDLRADLLDDAHRLVPENVARVYERAKHLVQVQVRSADAARGDLDDRVGRLLDLRVGDLLDAHVVVALPSQRSQDGSSPGLVELATREVR
jgi:hypothetical protein